LLVVIIFFIFYFLYT
ncbi:hypothetical protein MPH_13434, partial [Macrophomina phaseolina MS6]